MRTMIFSGLCSSAILAVAHGLCSVGEDPQQLMLDCGGGGHQHLGPPLKVTHPELFEKTPQQQAQSDFGFDVVGPQPGKPISNRPGSSEPREA